MNSSRPRAVLYARLSQDLTGTGVKVAQQLDDCRALAEARGWQVIDEQHDNDVSALRGAHRDGYERVLDLVRAGQTDYVVVWQTSRLLRNRKERAAAIELFSAQRVGIITVKGADLDLSTAYGRGMAGLLGEFDTMESEVKSERVAAAAAHRAAAGRPSGYLGYGWMAEGKGPAATWTVHPEQAEVVHEITRRLLGGESLNAVTVDLNDRGVQGPVVARWGSSSVKKIAIRPSNAGLRLHHRGRLDEQLFQGTWQPLVERGEWERVTALLTDPARNASGNTLRPGARKHLLTFGIGECGVCGSVLRCSPRGSKGARQLAYVCDTNECVGRNKAKVDGWVTARVLAALSRPDALDLWAPDRNECRRVAELVEDLKARLTAATDLLIRGKMTAAQYERCSDELQPQIDAAEAERRRALAGMDLTLVSELRGAEDALGHWQDWSVEQRRALLHATGFRVVIKPTRRGPVFRDEDVVVERRATV